MDYMDLAVHCPQKAVKLNHSLTRLELDIYYFYLHTFKQHTLMVDFFMNDWNTWPKRYSIGSPIQNRRMQIFARAHVELS